MIRHVRRRSVVGQYLVWFPDPSVMRMRGKGKKGLGITIPSHGPEAGI